MATTLQSIIDVYFDKAAHDMKNIDVTLKQLEIRFRELAGQERLLFEAYKDVDKKLK